LIDLPSSTFLLPDATALVEAAVFLLVMFVVSKFVLPRLQTLARRRQQLIDHDLKSAAAAKAAAHRREHEAAELVRQARRQARAIIDEAYERRDYLVADGMRKGREEYEWFTRKLDPARVRPLVGPLKPAIAATRSFEEKADSASVQVG
jgi:hypothetical protein